MRDLNKDIIVLSRYEYDAKLSNPFLRSFAFVYEISILNNSDRHIQLFGLKWNTIDIGDMSTTTKIKYCEGVKQFSRIMDSPTIGISGQFPILAPDQTVGFKSGCIIHAEIGHMVGSIYAKADIQPIVDIRRMFGSKKIRPKFNHSFDITIPPFTLCTPALDN